MPRLMVHTLDRPGVQPHIIVGRDRKAFVIDPSDASFVDEVVQRDRLDVRLVAWTHAAAAFTPNAWHRPPVKKHIGPMVLEAYLPTLQIVEDGAAFNFGARWTVLSPDSKAIRHALYYCASQHILLSGDILFGLRAGRLERNEYRGVRQLIARIAALPDDTQVHGSYDGGGVTRLGDLKAKHPLFTAPTVRRFEEILDKLAKKRPGARPLR